MGLDRKHIGLPQRFHHELRASEAVDVIIVPILDSPDGFDDCYEAAGVVLRTRHESIPIRFTSRSVIAAHDLLVLIPVDPVEWGAEEQLWIYEYAALVPEDEFSP